MNELRWTNNKDRTTKTATITKKENVTETEKWKRGWGRESFSHWKTNNSIELLILLLFASFCLFYAILPLERCVRFCFWSFSIRNHREIPCIGLSVGVSSEVCWPLLLLLLFATRTPPPLNCFHVRVCFSWIRVDSIWQFALNAILHAYFTIWPNLWSICVLCVYDGRMAVRMDGLFNIFEFALTICHFADLFTVGVTVHQ